jgi:protein AroM
MATLGIAVIGQAPRGDIADLFRSALPPGTTIVLRGCLDGLTDSEVDALPPRDGADTLYTRLRGERDVKVSKSAVIDRAPATLDRLREDGADALLFACTGEFPSMPGDAGVVFPSRVLAGLTAGLLPAGRLGLLVPAPEQIETLAAKWRRPGVEVVAEALLPSAGQAEAAAAGRRLAARRPDLVAMDCMSYTPDTKAAVKAELGVPTVLAVTATARVLQELMG